jgi:predicted lipid-binding transport protein (Tim44 family)
MTLMKNSRFIALFFTALFALTLIFASASADARRLGGGGSFGKQSPNVTRQAAPPSNVGNAGAAAAAPRRPFGAMLGGLAAGLGLAWLASSLGLGGAFGQIIMFALLAVLVMVVVSFVMRKLRANQGNGSRNGNFAFQSPANASAPQSYKPENVGNDSSARPWEGANTAFESKNTDGAASGSMIGSALGGSQNWGVPAGFDTDGFLKACKVNFHTLQEAWDKSDIGSLRAMMTDDMLDQIKVQLTDRSSHTGIGTNKTDVAMLEAQLLGIEELAEGYMASVEFSGMIREDAATSATPFREVWNMTKAKTGGGWLVAGVQALQ